MSCSNSAKISTDDHNLVDCHRCDCCQLEMEIVPWILRVKGSTKGKGRRAKCCVLSRIEEYCDEQEKECGGC